MDEDKTMVSIKLPARLKEAATAEADRRGISLSALVKNYLSSFLPESIGKSRQEAEEVKE